jgi:hypothetical protein
MICYNSKSCQKLTNFDNHFLRISNATMANANTAMRQNWIAVASADHARRSRDEMMLGFMQVCHGKLAPIKRV